MSLRIHGQIIKLLKQSTPEPVSTKITLTTKECGSCFVNHLSDIIPI